MGNVWYRKTFGCVYDKYLDITHFFRNLWRLRKLIWKWRWWDQEHLIESMCILLEDMEEGHRKYGGLVRSEWTANSLRKSRLMLESVYQDRLDVFNWEEDPACLFHISATVKPHIPFFRKYMICHDEKMSKQNLEIAFKYLARHIGSYWD